MAGQQGILALVLVALVSGWTAHSSQRVVDEMRYQQGAWEAERMRPNGPVLRTSAMGYHTMLADAMWLRTVLIAAEVYEDPQPSKVAWLRESLLAIATLDPSWRTLYFYGGGFLAVAEDIEGSNQVFELGHEALPEDPYFPFSRGMNVYLYPDPDDPEGSKVEAAEWIEVAAELPGAPGWYKGTVAVFRSEAGEGQRSEAIRYLEEQLERETRPVAKALIEERLAKLQHDELVDVIERARIGFEIETGQPLVEPTQIPLPPDPRGGQWVLGADGQIRSDVAEAEKLERAQRLGREYLTHGARKTRGATASVQ